MRDIDTDIVAALQAGEIRPVLLLDCEIDGTHYRYTDADVPVVANVGAELHDDGNAASDPAGNEADGTTGWSQSGLDSGANVFESQGAVVDEGDYALHANCNDTPGNQYRFYKDIGTDFALEADEIYEVRFSIRHVGTGHLWRAWLSSAATAGQAGDTMVAEVANTDTAFEDEQVQFVHSADTQYLVFREASATNDGGVYVDNLSLRACQRFEPRGARLEAAKYSLNRVVDSLRIELDNLDDALTAAFAGGTPQGGEVSLKQALLNSDNQVIGAPVTWFQGEIDEWSLTEEKVSFTVASELVRWNQRTLAKHSASCRWKEFKGTRCAYAGAETWCDRTYTRCAALGNQANFGGFRWLPSIMEKEIWWGRTRAV